MRESRTPGSVRGVLRNGHPYRDRARCAGIQLPTWHCAASSAFRNLGLGPGENSSRHLNENSCLRFRAMMEPYSESRLFREKILPL